jgi:hypothetical protein
MSKRGMLGDIEVLRRLLRGPLQDLLMRLNGPDGPAWEEALKRFLRTENPLERRDPQFTVEIEGEKVGFVVVSLAELGFEGKTRRRLVWREASARGLCFCPTRTTCVAFEVCKQLCAEHNGRLVLAEKPRRKDGQTISLAVFSASGQSFIDAPIGSDFIFEPGELFLFKVA